MRAVWSVGAEALPFLFSTAPQNWAGGVDDDGKLRFGKQSQDSDVMQTYISLFRCTTATSRDHSCLRDRERHVHDEGYYRGAWVSVGELTKPFCIGVCPFANEPQGEVFHLIGAGQVSGTPCASD